LQPHHREKIKSARQRAQREKEVGVVDTFLFSLFCVFLLEQHLGKKMETLLKKTTTIEGNTIITHHSAGEGRGTPVSLSFRAFLSGGFSPCPCTFFLFPLSAGGLQ
jgi:hypothetical protein